MNLNFRYQEMTEPLKKKISTPEMYVIVLLNFYLFRHVSLSFTYHEVSFPK